MKLRPSPPLRYEPYAWILQDAFAVCLVVLFLQVVRLGSIKVAAVLLCCAFAYDVFFVFLSPLVFGSSVMIKVAIGDGPAADADYCEKYADDPKCRPTSLPFLLQIPRVDDYMGGAAMLGLGDLVLPGLIVAFAARYDVSTGRGAAPRAPSRGPCAELRAPAPLAHPYYRLMVIGYAVGLMMANVAVYAMDMGQPALLYLVPCTLGAFCVKAKREGELAMMWEGPPSLTGVASAPPARGAAAAAAPPAAAAAADVENQGLLGDAAAADGPSCELPDINEPR